MAFRCEVRSLRRPDEWLPFDVCYDTQGRRRIGRRRYEQLMLRAHPILSRREYRIVEFDAPPMYCAPARVLNEAFAHAR